MSTMVADLEAPGGDEEDERAQNEMAALDVAEEAEGSEAPEQSAPSAAAPVVDKESVLFWTGPWEDAVVSDATGGKR